MAQLHLSRRKILLAGGALASFVAWGFGQTKALAGNRWEGLPETPPMPPATTSGYMDVNDVTLWYATFGEGKPLILLHGGMGNSEQWAGQIPEFARQFKVIVHDSRGHGRSTRTARPYTYELMASDTVALMDRLQIEKASVVGFSDGGVIGLAMAIHNPERLDRLVVFGTNYNTTGMKNDFADKPAVKLMKPRVKADYLRLSKTPADFHDFVTAIFKMWDTQPNFSEDQIRGIHVRTAVVDGEYDEFIKRSHTERLAAFIPNSELIILPDVSHFAMWQDPAAYNAAVLGFLTRP